MKKILIVGAGFSGSVIAARLIRLVKNVQTHIYLINGGGRIARGMAYGTQSQNHVLNVPVGNMSAFEDDQEHFLRYAQEIDSMITPSSFVSRRIYGDYLEWTLSEAERNMSGYCKLVRIYQNVNGIQYVSDGGSAIATLSNGEKILADHVVLALGHFNSSRLPITMDQFAEDPRFISDPWDHARIDMIPSRASVLLLGTGLTAVDTAMTLLSRNPNRTITAISRRGLIPQSHRHSAGKPEGSGSETIWGAAETVRAQLKAFRQYCSTLKENGRDWREGFALLRPVTAKIWQSYSEKERRRFLRHVQPYWDTHRHRLAPSIAEQFFTALSDGSVKTLAGRILDFDITDQSSQDNQVKINIKPRGLQNPRSLFVHYIINCTGPCANPQLAKNDLVKQLLSVGMIRSNQLGLGIDVSSNYAVIDRDGKESQNLFYIGPWLKADYWEATAVPDLRVIANRIANLINEAQ